MSFKNYDHWTQIILTQRFQEYVDDWSYPDTYAGTLFDMEAISTIPVSMIVGEDDE